MQHRHGRQVEGVAGVGLKGADAALAEDDLLVAAGHDVFGAHQQLLDGVGTGRALSRMGLFGLAQLLEQLEVLHVARADLDDVHVLEQRQVVDVHDLGNDRQTGAALGLQQQLYTLVMQALESVGRSARLERAAAQQVCAALLTASAMHITCSGDSTEQGPAMNWKWPPPIATPSAI